MKPKPYILITCEHADYKVPNFVTSKIPSLYKSNNLAHSHQAYDEYAYDMSLILNQEFKKMGFKTDVISYPYTRLIIDANRTKKNKGFYSKLSLFLSAHELKKIESEYDKYVNKTNLLIQKNLKTRDVLLFSIHSFTPEYKGKKRKTDIGLLFRTKVKKELELALSLQNEIKKNDPKINVHRNLPYRGHTDCFSNSILDQHLKNKKVNGLFFEFNQNYIKSGLAEKAKLTCDSVIKTIGL